MEALRELGFTGSLTIIGDEPHEPYDRPPLSEQVLKGWVPADHTALPRMRAVDADRRLGVAATGLDRAAKQVRLADGERVGYDRLLIATGTRARPWPNPAEATLQGVHTIRSRDDAAELQKELAEPPSRVLVIGAGFIGSEVASVCRELDIPVTVVERGSAAPSGALGGVIGEIAARMQRDHGVDLRCGLGVSSLEGDAGGHVVENPRLVEDPPPYRRNQIFRGPRHVLVDIDGIRDRPRGNGRGRVSPRACRRACRRSRGAGGPPA
ncbi:NAD(P)/FAD-dependent oxidoreductase [Streptomyces virginiae]|uniref:NAD(P)/FAD-dependent oxidoreductase n=1 Tax=Streptomyces virginiae TaxID=1961 RepID=UPI00364B2A1F